MTNTAFIEAMPKVELNVFLEGAIQTQTLLMLADHNEISETLKRYETWVSLINEPDYARVYEIARMASSWLKQPDDLTRIVYDVATSLAKQNVRYAEMSVNPALFSDMNLSFEDFLVAINDGRDRAQRAWGIELAWVFIIPREEPRRADELARWATTAAARRGGVVALGVSGDEASQPIGQFERAFKSAEKKDVARVARIREKGAKGAESILKAIEILNPTRLIDAWGADESPDTLTALVDNDITMVVSPTRAVKQGWVATVADYPLRKLYDSGISLVLGSDMPTFYHTSLNGEYLAAVEQCGLLQEELENLALNAVRSSMLDADAKAEMVKSFEQAYAELKLEPVEAEEPAS